MHLGSNGRSSFFGCVYEDKGFRSRDARGAGVGAEVGVEPLPQRPDTTTADMEGAWVVVRGRPGE